MVDIHAKNWDNYWQGRASQQSGNALIEVGIEHSHDLKAFWRDIFSNEKKAIKVIDFACGAGSVLKHAQSCGIKDLTGLDVSTQALHVMAQKIIGSKAICSAVDDTPLPADTYDLAVSQFGIEYAGSKGALFKAFSEMYRVIKPNGKVIIVAHSLDGLIVEGCRASLEHIRLIEDSAFLETSEEIVQALHNSPGSTKETELDSLSIKLNKSAKPIMEWLKSFQDLEKEKTKNEFIKFAYHLLESSHRLITHHYNYSIEDSLNWYKGIGEELQAYKGRMLSMTKAALSSQDISELQGKLTTSHGNSKINFKETETLHFNSSAKPAAWVIHAEKI